jgi:hypothetical protein
MTFIQSVRRTLHIGRVTAQKAAASGAPAAKVLPGPEIDIPIGPQVIHIASREGRTAMSWSLAAQVRRARWTAGELLVRSLMVGALLGLAACGGASTPATGSPAPDDAGEAGQTAAPAPASGAGEGAGGESGDSCLVDADDVSAALEADVADAASSEVPGVGGTCLYTDAAGSVVLSISVLTGQGGRSSLDALDAAGDEEVEPVSGIGDEAYLTFIAERWALWFGKASVAVGVGPLDPNLLGGDSARQRAAIEELARAAAARL